MLDAMNRIASAFVCLSLLPLLSSCAAFRKAQLPAESNENEELNIGYGTVSRKNNTYSVDKVTVNQNEIGSYNNIYDYLRGRVAGVQIGPANGHGEPSVTIRGINSINSGTNPLYVVDGVTVDSIMWVNPNDVQSVDVLKDASASIYGVRGANGVIVITTKTGRSEAEADAKKAERDGKPKVSVDVNYGVRTR